MSDMFDWCEIHHDDYDPDAAEDIIRSRSRKQRWAEEEEDRRIEKYYNEACRQEFNSNGNIKSNYNGGNTMTPAKRPSMPQRQNKTRRR